MMDSPNETKTPMKGEKNMTTLKIYEQQIHDGGKKTMLKRKFFYTRNGKGENVRKNCYYVEIDGSKILVSYKTIVCMIQKSGQFVRFWDDYSVTTLNQINCFLNLFECYHSETGEILKGFSKKEWEKYSVQSKYDFISANVLNEIKQTLPEIILNERNDYIKKIIYK